MKPSLEVKADTASTESKPRVFKKNKKRSKAPKPGEEGYLTPTQLRNARKRRTKRQAHHPSKKKDDPSLVYISNPKKAPILQTAREYFQSLKVGLGVTLGPTHHWRTLAKLAVRPSPDNGQVEIGLFAPNSHTLIPVPQCVAHHPSINAAVVMLEKLCTKVGVKAYDEQTEEGYLKHVAIAVERATSKVQITLVWNSEPYEETQGSDEDEGSKVLDAVCKAIIANCTPASETISSAGRKRRRGRQEKVPSVRENEEPKPFEQHCDLHSLWVHYNSDWKHSNAIFSVDGDMESWESRFGPSYIAETMDLKDCGWNHSVKLRFPPNVFRQANLDAFGKIVAEIRRRISKFAKKQRRSDRNAPLPKCIELYGGVGTIGLHVADLTSSLVSSDENPFNKECFAASAKELPPDISQRVSYKPMNATDMVKAQVLQGADIVIVDPPRKGLESQVLKALSTETSPQLLIYVSCGFDAFKRDCTALLSSRWRLDHVEGHLLFPGSDAIETLAIFVAQQ